MPSSSHTSSGLPELTQPSISPYKLAVLLVLLAIIGIMLVTSFASSDEAHERNIWQNELNLIADSRAADVEAWLNGHFRDLTELASNPSLQLYLTELETAKTTTTSHGPAIEDPAQAVYLRNLLLVTADRLGFENKTSDALKSVHANVHKPAGTGLVIIDNSGKVLVSTDGLPALDAALAVKVEQAPKGQASLIDMFASPEGEIHIGFVLPIYPIQGDSVASQQIGKLVGIKTVNDDFFKLLQHPGTIDKALEAVLVRKEGENVIYLSQQKDTQKEAAAVPLSTRFLLSTPDLDAAYALSNPGVFASKIDRQSRRVLMTSRAIAGSPWVLLLHIDRDQAFAESDSRRSKMVSIMVLALIAIIASVWGAWWYGTSRRAMLLSLQTGRLAAHSVAQEKLLRLVTDNQPEPIFIADQKNVVRFANEKAAKLFNIHATDVVGKDLTALLGQAAAAEYSEASKSALTFGKSLAHTHRVGEETHQRLIRSEHIPLSHIPIDSLPFPSPGVLVVDQDITQIVAERERRARTLNQLIETLVRMVDERDPYAANHSSSVALVAREVATGMGLERNLIETAETAGRLMNIGKIVVPSKILTKRDALAEDEIQAIRDSLSRSVTLLEGIEFDGPVVETLRQAAERYDGTGPLKLKGEDILVTARIIAVSNSFIGMISPRSYRAAISIEQATTMMLANIDTQFDRRVVVALINFIENKQGKEMLSQLSIKKVG